MKKLALLLGICSILIFAGIASADTLVKTTETNFGDGILYTGEPTIYLINDTAARVLYQWDISDATKEYLINSTDYYINDNTYSNNGAIYEPSNYQLNNLGGGMFNLSSTYYFLFAKWLVGTWTGNLKLCNSTDGKTTATENCKDVSTIADQTGFFMADFYIPNDNEAWIYYVENPSANNWTFKRRIYYRGNDTFGDEDTLFYEGFDITRALRIREFNSTVYIYYSHYSNSLYVRNSTDGLNFNDSQTIVSAISYGEFEHQIFYLQGKYHLVIAGDNVELFTSDYPDNSFSYQRILIYNVRSPFSVAVSGTKFIIATSNLTGGYPYNKNIYMSQWEYVPFVLNFVPPTPDSGSYTNQLDFTVNVSADTTLSDCWLNFQGLNLTMTVIGNYCYFTKSLSVNNCFSYKVYANSTASDLVVTPTRGICQDNSPPLVTIISPQNITYNTTNISLEVSANDTIDNWWYSLNGGANTTFSPNTTITGTEGSNEIIVYANDTTAGNIGIDTEYFTITIPSLNITWNTPANKSFTLNLSSILWNATISETPDTCILNINGTANYSMLISGNDCYYTTSSLTNQTTYCGIIYANNSIYNISSMRCATINLTSEVTPPTPRPIDNMGLFGGVALLVMGAGIILFLLEGLFGAGALLRNPKGIMLVIIGAIIMAAMILALL